MSDGLAFEAVFRAESVDARWGAWLGVMWIVAAIADWTITRIIAPHRPEAIASRADAIFLLTGATTKLLDREAFWRLGSGGAEAMTAFHGISESEDLEHA